MKDLELLQQDPNNVNETWVKCLEDLSIWYYYHVEDLFLDEAHSLHQAAHSLHISIYNLLKGEANLVPDPKDPRVRLLVRALNCCLSINHSFDESCHPWSFYSTGHMIEEWDGNIL